MEQGGEEGAGGDSRRIKGWGQAPRAPDGPAAPPSTGFPSRSRGTDSGTPFLVAKTPHGVSSGSSLVAWRLPLWGQWEACRGEDAKDATVERGRESRTGGGAARAGRVVAGVPLPESSSRRS